EDPDEPGEGDRTATSAADRDGPDEATDDLVEQAAIATEYLAAMRDRFEASLTSESAFSIIATNARLTTLDAAVLAIVMAVEADPALARVLATAERRERPTNVTLRALSAMLDGWSDDEAPVRSRLVPDAPLRRAALCDLIDVGPPSLFHEQTVTAPHAVVWTLLGDRYDDPDLPDRIETIELPTSERDGAPLTVIAGHDRRLRLIEAARHTSGTRFITTTAPDSDASWAALVRTATMHGHGVIVEVDGSLTSTARRWIERATHLSWAIASARDLADHDLPDRPWVEHQPTDRAPTDQEWRAVFGDDVERSHPLTHDQMYRVARLLPAVDGDLDRAVRRLISGRLDGLATRVRPSRTWDDIVLSPGRTAQLRAIADRYRYRTRVFDEWGFAPDTMVHGLVAAFAGPSGTGKTLAAEVIAGELGLDLFKLNLSAVVSKYIGETEKNLEEIFGAAAAGDLVLFFDEADALFGKRSEVKDARDRYANIEVSYLLQRIERYDGMVILATNLEKNIDDAFLRRIQARIEFAMPTVDERRQIWERNLPPGAPVVDIDVDWLAAHFEITGASIRNAAIHAAFRAAATGSTITMETAVLGVAQEYRKLGRLVKEVDFAEHYLAASLV
ncbi:MAG: ATPase, partial [Acidimicrobiaceae bacterium]|nr:ATPase [Acidimicrobiaceae bacterium]